MKSVSQKKLTAFFMHDQQYFNTSRMNYSVRFFVRLLFFFFVWKWRTIYQLMRKIRVKLVDITNNKILIKTKKKHRIGRFGRWHTEIDKDWHKIKNTKIGRGVENLMWTYVCVRVCSTTAIPEASSIKKECMPHLLVTKTSFPVVYILFACQLMEKRLPLDSNRMKG